MDDTIKILNSQRLVIPTEEPEDEFKKYGSNSAYEWVLKIIPEQGKKFTKDKIWELFDYEWRSKNSGTTIYGFCPELNYWTYAISGDSPDYFDTLEVGISLIYDGESEITSETLLPYLANLKEKLKQFPFKTTVVENIPISEAVIKANKIRIYKNEFNKDFGIMLKSDSQFMGSRVLSTLEKVGLECGDGEIFHWYNYTQFGGDIHFSVWTLTEPRFFFIDDLANDDFNPNDLVFGFIIPRSADPETIFEIVIEVATYCQSKLGGKLLNAEMKPFDVEAERKNLKELVAKMKKEGFIPGSNMCLRLFH